MTRVDAMDAVQPQTNPAGDQTSTLQFSIETLFYIGLVLLALVLRLADLDIVPMSDLEAAQALPAWHLLNPDAPGMPQPASSPVVFWLQVIGFAFAGGTDVAARLPGVLGGIGLALMPLLFRSRFGRVRSAAMALLLALSPVALVASRTASPALWTMIFAIGFLGSTWRYWETRKTADAWWGAAWLTALVSLAQPGGIVLALILIAAIGAALIWAMLDAPELRETPGDDLWYAARDALRQAPWYSIGAIVLLVVVTCGTGFMLYPGGLGIIAQAVGGTLPDIVRPYQDGAPVAFPLLSLIVYNPLLIIFGAAGVGLVLMRRPAFSDRVVLVWLLAAFLILLFYRGASPAMALWLVVPLVYFTSYVVEWLTGKTYVPSFFYGNAFYDSESFDPDETNDDAYWWVKWIVAAGALLLYIMAMVHIGDIARSFSNLPEQWSLMTLSEPAFADFRYGFIWLLITLMLMVVGYLTTSSFFGNEASLQGAGLGLLVFMLVTGIASGWNTAVVNATNPAEFWHISPPTKDVTLLRQSLNEIAQRDTGGFPDISVTIVMDEATGITDDGLVAWLVRDFDRAQFVETDAVARRDEIVLLPADRDAPDLGGSYVGQSFVLRRHWSVRNVRAIDIPAWWIQRRVPQQEFQGDGSILWVRLDVYDAVPIDERPPQ